MVVQASNTVDDTVKGIVIAKAVIRSADHLGVSGGSLAKTIGMSPAGVTRLRGGSPLHPGKKDYELAVLFIRLFRSLDSITGGDVEAAKSWMRGHNLVLDGRPIELIQTIQGLINVIAYLDARRAIV